MLLADKVLKQLGKEKAKDKYKVNKCSLCQIFVEVARSQIGTLIAPFLFIFQMKLSAPEPWTHDALASVHQVLL